MKAQASLEFLLIGSGIAVMCLFVLTFYSRNLFSQSSALAAIANGTQNASYYDQPQFLFDYSVSTATTTAAPAYTAAISGRSEELAYAIGKPSYVTNLTEFSHCASVGFYGHALNVSGQCGTANAWDYLAGYDCPRSGAYCIIPQNTSYSTESVSGQRAYVYNITLTLGSPYGAMTSSISSAANASPVMLDGQKAGYASVSGVSSADASPSATLMYDGSAYSLANQTYLQLYTQEKSTLYPMLAFYNGTSVDGATQLEIQQTVNAFSDSQTRLLAGSSATLQCDVSGGYYVCNSTLPFDYLINVTLSPSYAEANQTLYYLGSVISIRSS